MLLPFLLVLYGLNGLVTGVDWYVSNGLPQSEGCGGLINPCHDLGYTIREAQNGDTIILMQSVNMFPLCDTEGGVEITQKSLTIKPESPGRKTIIGCEGRSDGGTILQFNSLGDTLTLQNINVVNGNIIIDNGTLVIEDVLLEDVILKHTDDSCEQMGLSMSNSKWTNTGLCERSEGCSEMTTLKCETLDVQLDTSRFTASPMSLIGRNTHVRVSNVLMNGAGLTADGLKVTVVKDGDVTVEESYFTNFISPSLTHYVQNLFQASLLVRATFKTEGNMTLTVNACLFYANERAITVMGEIRKVDIDNCTFTENVAMHSGAAVLSLVEEETQLTISRSTFTENKGGYIKRNFKVAESEEHAHIVGDTVILNSANVKGSMEAVGRGGAIRLQRGTMRIADSSFYANTANIQGGTIMSDRETNLVLDNVLINGPATGYQPILGDILCSRGETELNNVHFIAHQGKIGLSVLQHTGQHWSIQVKGIRVDCPVGHSIRLQEVSAFGVTGSGMLSSTHSFDELAYHCDACPRGLYSLDHGFVNNTLIPDAYSYFSFVLGSADKRQPNYTGDYVYHQIQCISCTGGDVPNENRYTQTLTQEEQIKWKALFMQQCSTATAMAFMPKINLVLASIAVALHTWGW